MYTMWRMTWPILSVRPQIEGGEEGGFWANLSMERVKSFGKVGRCRLTPG